MLHIALAFSVLLAVPFDDDSVRESPQVIHRPAEMRVGELIGDFTFAGVAGRAGALAAIASESNAVVIAMRDVDCPLAKRYGPSIARLEDGYRDRGVSFLYLNVNAVDSPEQMRGEIEQFGFDGPYIHNPGGAIARRLGATSTTEVFVLDRARTLIYRGAIDDQYGIGYQRTVPRETYLADALEAVLADEIVDVEATTAPGCVLNPDDAETRDAAGGNDIADVTYHEHVSRIVQRNCLSCHHGEGVAPFPLETYAQVNARGAMIKYVVNERIMPPWGAAHGSGPWRNDSSLTEREERMLLAWLEAGAPEGPAGAAPLARTWPDLTDPTQWAIGEPDYTVSLPEAVHIPAEGALDYMYFWVKTDLPDDKWVEQVEFKPTAPQQVHHSLIFIEAPRMPEESRRDYRRRWQGGLDGYFVGMVPGQGPTRWGDGMAKKLPAGAWLKFQMHYTPNGTPAIDQMEVAFKFADDPPAIEIQTSSAAETRFEIPPGAPNHEIVAEQEIPFDATLFSVWPHMHLRGKAFRYDLIYPDGREELLVEVPRYDFNWQIVYQFAEPKQVPAGSVLRATAWYDNSADNPANPDPSATVHFGEQTWDEMMIGYFEWWRTE